MLGYLLSGVLALVVITIFVVLVRRQLRWSHPEKGRGPGYVQGAKPDHVPVSVTNPESHAGGGF